ncbi:hypothetical protein AURDEDRAFT_115693 [Auricularia subglabra TFB-10046 SS5]|uniref:Uncharacterized protein n=1 Tax=Auricularia subglabra (strain TFB-10046 / SS5) TaxID=717982 RepID=J0WY39_AURST|nr:hypothetical protein AURDEDRAFT_115693 [Auricularia subglabra TFB-10046 SS5]
MLWPQVSIPQARLLALDTLRKLGVGATFTSKELYNAVHTHFPDAKVDKKLVPPMPGETRPAGLKEKVRLSVQPTEQGVLPPRPDHPIRSVSYLKHIVLDDLQRRRIVKKVHSFREPTAKELAERDPRVRNLRVFPRNPETGRTTGEPPLLLKRVNVWKWQLLPAGEALLKKRPGTDVLDRQHPVLGRAAREALKAQLREERMVGPRLVVWQ